MGARNPSKDQVALAATGTTPYIRHGGDRTAAALACDASRAAIVRAGLSPADIDGICGSHVPTATVQASLGIPAVTWWANSTLPFGLLLVEAVNAVFAGACTTALVYHSTYRGPGASRAAGSDRFRLHAVGDTHAHNVQTTAETPTGTFGYCAWAARYLHEFGETRETLGRIAVNSRTNATRNPHALYRQPLTMEDYMAGRMVREPLCVFDMDPPVDGGDAVIVTTAERARDLRQRPVYVHAATYGRTRLAFADQLESYRHSGKEVVAEALWEKSDVALEDIDIFLPYDGFSIIALSWFEAVGYCKVGEGGVFIRDQWVPDEGRILIDGRVPVNSHGGSLSEGATQGAGHIREAVEQLSGTAGDRQVSEARAALATTGGFLWNATGLILRSD
jgi:acetyl-CoA acetyltransferase